MFGVRKELVDVNMKIVLREFGGVWAATVHLFRCGKRFWYLFFAMMLQLLPYVTKAAAPVPRQEVIELGNGSVDITAEEREFRNDLRTPMRIRQWDAVNGGPDGGSECLSRSCPPGATIVASAKMIREKRDADGTNDNPSAVENDVKKIIKEIIQGALFALPIVLFIFWLSTPSDPWGGLPNPYLKTTSEYTGQRMTVVKVHTADGFSSVSCPLSSHSEKRPCLHIQFCENSIYLTGMENDC